MKILKRLLYSVIFILWILGIATVVAPVIVFIITGDIDDYCYAIAYAEDYLVDS